MAFAQVAATAVSSDNGATQTVCLPSCIACGDLLIAVYFTTADDTATWPAGWCQIGSIQQGASGVEVEVRYRNANGCEGCTFNITGCDISANIVYRITGHDPLIAPEGTFANGVSATANPPCLNPGGCAKDFLWLAGFTIKHFGPITDTPDCYTNELNAPNCPYTAIHAVMQRELNAASHNPTAYVNTNSACFVVFTVAIHPASACCCGCCGGIYPNVSGWVSIL